MAFTADLHERAVLEGVRAEALERRIDALRRPWLEDVGWWDWEWRLRELKRLQEVVTHQAEQIARLRAELREAQEAARLVALRDLVEAVVAALQRGSNALADVEVTEASVELKVLLGISRGTPGLLVGPAGPVDPRTLSTLRMELRPADRERLARLLEQALEHPPPVPGRGRPADVGPAVSLLLLT